MTINNLEKEWRKSRKSVIVRKHGIRTIYWSFTVMRLYLKYLTVMRTLYEFGFHNKL